MTQASRRTMPKRACGCCGRVVAMRNRASNKARVRHKCPHGRWCPTGGINGAHINAGGTAHRAACENCGRTE